MKASTSNKSCKLAKSNRFQSVTTFILNRYVQAKTTEIITKKNKL